MADPRLEEGFDEATGESVFQSKWLTYRIAATPGVSEAVAQQYREFSDWSAR